MGVITQIVFFIFELMQLHKAGCKFCKYIKDDPWNLWEFSSLFFYIGYFVMMKNIDFVPDLKNVWVTIVRVIVLTLGYIKIMYFMRQFETFGSLV